MLKIKFAEDDEEYDKVLEIRRKVFIEEQDVPEDIEIDEHEDGSEHVIAFLDNEPAGCARMRKVKDKIKLERLAVLKKYRGRGIGKKIMEFLVREAKKKYPDEIYMNAQYYLKGFYEKLGFRTRGNRFKEAGIDHIEMFITPK